MACIGDSGVARGDGGAMWVHLHPIHAPVHPSYACVVVLFTYSLSQFHYTVTASNVRNMSCISVDCLHGVPIRHCTIN